MTQSNKIINKIVIVMFVLVLNGFWFVTVANFPVSAEACDLGRDSEGNCIRTPEQSGSGSSAQGQSGVGSGGQSGTGSGGPSGIGTDGPKTSGSVKLVNPIKVNSISEFLTKVLKVLLIFALPIIVIYIMYAGFLFVTARGNTEQISTAKTALLWAIVGGVIVLGAELILKIIQGTVAGT